MGSQLDILEESLDKKIRVLEEIQKLNEEQEHALKCDEVDLEAFDVAVEEKDRLIDKILKLDEGFETLYAEVAEELKGNQEYYTMQIKALQEKISRITQMSVSIQAQEARNKKLVEAYFAKTRSALKKNRRNSKAAYDYYRNMSGSDMRQSQFLDSKK